MVFWIGLLIAVGFAYSAIKLGFYQAWTMLFNVVIAVYLGIKLGPMVEEFVPMQSQYCGTLAVLAVGVGTFLILHGISYTFLLGQFEVTFPRVVNTLGSGLVGFLAGFLIWSYASVVICTAPFSDNDFVRGIGFDARQLETAKVQPYLVWWCNFVDKFVSTGQGHTGTEETIKDLLNKPTKSKTAGFASRPGSANANEPNEPNEIKCPNTPPGRETPAPHTIIPP
jgi:hypothetical protein